MKNVADVYALTPMQSFMYLHSARRADDALFSQLCYTLDGPLDTARLEVAGQALIDRHPVFRTAFVAVPGSAPLQVVRQHVDVPFLEHDLTDAADQDAAVVAWLEADRRQGFDLRKAPLVRIGLLRLAEHRHLLVWSSHHLVMDRWCIGLFWQELSALYRDPAVALPPSHGGFRRYVQWLARQDRDEAERFWRDELMELDEPLRLTASDHAAAAQVIDMPIEAAVRRGLADLARRHRCTYAGVLQAAWALQICASTGAATAVFGCAVAGRPGDIDDVESIMGSFVSNVPVVVPVDPRQTLSALLQSLHAAQQRRMRYEWLSPIEIERVSPIPQTACYDALFVALADAEPPSLEGVRVTGWAGRLSTAHPLTLACGDPSGALGIRGVLAAGRRLREGRSLGTMLSRFVGLLEELSRASGDERLSSLQSLQVRRPARAPAGRVRLGSPARGAPISATGARERASLGDTRTVLASLWSEMLESVDAAGLDDDADFFELGGDSLAAVKLHAALETATRTNLPLVELFQQPTLGRMARMLTEGDWPLQGGHAMAVRPSGAAPPVFCIASPEVNTLGYVMLTRHLHREIPVFILQAPPGDDAAPARVDPAALPLLAADYVAAMRQIQPEGPYQLIGMCTGAHIAHHMAVSLQRQGQPVAHLGLINTWAMFTVSPLYHLTRIANRARWYGGRVRDLASADPHLRRSARAAALRKLGRRMPPGIESPAGAVVNATGAVVNAADSTLDWIDDVGWARRRQADYPIFDGRTVVYRIRRQPYWRTGENDLGWGALAAQGAEVERLSCAIHDHILREPSVREVAERIGHHLCPELPRRSNAA